MSVWPTTLGTLAALKSALPVNTADTSENSYLESLIDAASEGIAAETERRRTAAKNATDAPRHRGGRRLPDRLRPALRPGRPRAVLHRTRADALPRHRERPQRQRGGHVPHVRGGAGEPVHRPDARPLPAHEPVSRPDLHKLAKIY